MKKITALLLALVMALTLFTACGDEIVDNPIEGPGDNTPAVSGDVTQGEPPADNPVTDNIADGPAAPANPNPSNGETWNGYDISFVEENGIEYIWEALDNEKKENLASAMTAIREVTGFIPYKYPMPEEENYEFMQLILNCAMDYPYVRNQFALHDNDEDGNIDALTAVFNYEVVETEEQAWNMTAALNQKLDEIIAAMPDGTEYERLRYLHDYLVFNCKYSDSIPTFYTAYGALVDGQATCQGYADAMHLLLARAGFETVWCVGIGSDERVTHKWNYVKLSDGKWYIIDPTWADPADKDDPTYISYDYFLVSDEELLKDHKAKYENRFFTEPVAESMELNYHKQEGYFCETYDEAVEAVKKQLVSCAENDTHYIYLRMADENSFDEVADKLLKANRDDGSHGEIMQLIKEAAEQTGENFNHKSWSVYKGFEDGAGPLTFIVTIKYTE